MRIWPSPYCVKAVPGTTATRASANNLWANWSAVMLSYFNRRKNVKCAVRFDGREAHVGEPGVDVVAASDVFGVHGRGRVLALGQCADGGVLGWDACANGVVGVHFDGLFYPFGGCEQEADAPAGHGMGFG